MNVTRKTKKIILSSPKVKYQIRHYVSSETMIQLVMSFVISRIDYCNSVLLGLPVSTLAPLQRVQNAAARLILGLSHRSDITPALKQLHWLPIKFRIIFKVATIMHNILHNRSPPYLKDFVTFSVSGPQHRQLGSTTTRSAVVLRTRTQFGRRAFSFCEPDIWNSLPVKIRLIDSHPSFRRALKSHFLTSLLVSLFCVCLDLCNAQSLCFYIWLGTITFIM